MADRARKGGCGDGGKNGFASALAPIDQEGLRRGKPRRGLRKYLSTRCPYVGVAVRAGGRHSLKGGGGEIGGQAARSRQSIEWYRAIAGVIDRVLPARETDGGVGGTFTIIWMRTAWAEGIRLSGNRRSGTAL